MIANGLSWVWNRLRPAEGWLAFFLLGSAAACLILAVMETRWVPEDGVIIPATILGLLLATILAKRPLRTTVAWIYLTLYGFVIVTIDLARLFPTSTLISSNNLSVTQFWRQNAALFFDRTASWFEAVFSGGSSRETIVFAFGLGITAWFLGAYAGWSTFRQHKPLQGLTLMGVAITLNGYYGNAEIYWSAAFMGLAAIITAVLHFVHLEQEWDANQVDFSDQVRLDLIIYASVITVFLLSIATTLPAINFRELARKFQSQPFIQQTEDALDKAFAGVRQPQRGVSPGGVGGRGTMPRSYLLGDAPELSERIMMTAVVDIIEDDGTTHTAPADLLQGSHWRGLSYDVYTGRGWALSEERQESVSANQQIPIPPINRALQLSQTVNWEVDNRVIRYSLGLPLQVDQNVTVNWRGLDDLSRVQGEGPTQYKVHTQLTSATPDELRTASLQNVPPAILARYTALPPSIPQRVHDLAQEIGGAHKTPYDQARALETFLRQYPYSLDVPLPPGNTDPVDFFLFELQSGYCDYYASAMVVLARSLGLPARIAVGYLSQPPDAAGIQTIYQINAHSWAEIYFAGYGWVEFEPTAPFISPRDVAFHEFDPANTDTTLIDSEANAAPPPIPEPDQTFQITWGRIALLLLSVLLIGVWYRWQQRQKAIREANPIVWTYGRLQQHASRLGHIATPAQTPSEFATSFIKQLQRYKQYSRLQKHVETLLSPIHQLTELYQQQQYGQYKRKRKEADTAKSLWGKMKRPLRLLHFTQRLIKHTYNQKEPAD
ncbi:MAG: transglutaminase domain-containing protein [Anaerolineales bacterium]|nr:transglutaminase domain-containing protein [Anaerolineales bacterium]